MTKDKVNSSNSINGTNFETHRNIYNSANKNSIPSTTLTIRDENVLVSDKSDSLDLRPKFAILKHKLEPISNNGHNNNNNNCRKAVAAPAWFFDIPTFRSPFPDMSRHPIDEME